MKAIPYTITFSTYNFLNRLDPKDQNKIKAIQKVVGGKRDGVWDGLHGIIVNFSIREAAMSRLSKKQLQGLVKSDIRWIEAKPNRIAVGL
jgi:hypothetical protein